MHSAEGLDKAGKEIRSDTKLADFWGLILQNMDSYPCAWLKDWRGKLEGFGLRLEFLEEKQNLQGKVLTTYHLVTLIFGVTGSMRFPLGMGGRVDDSWKGTL